MARPLSPRPVRVTFTVSLCAFADSFCVFVICGRRSSRHCDAPLPRAPEGQRDLHKPHRKRTSLCVAAHLHTLLTCEVWRYRHRSSRGRAAWLTAPRSTRTPSSRSSSPRWRTSASRPLRSVLLCLALHSKADSLALLL